MIRADSEAKDDVEKFKKLFKQYVEDPLLENPDMLNGWWKFLQYFQK